MREQFSGEPDVVVIVDRREDDRRAPSLPVHTERRRSDRRTNGRVDRELRGSFHVLLPIDEFAD